ncbi:MAG: hypothetical protein ACKVVP_03250 [Chloroflexota bacterium]
MIERSFVRRKRVVRLQELTEVVAVQGKAPPGSATRKSQIPDSVAAALPQDQVTAFEHAGWIFVSSPADERTESASRARVFLKDDGRLALGANTLTIQFRDDATVEEANAALQPHAAQVLERLTFAPGLFRVAVSDNAPADAIELADQLARSESVVFAEPELIEELGHRRI